jgi:hypothetical protein
MITKLECRTPQGALLTLTLDDVTSGLIVKDIDGIAPVKATIVSSSYANLPGAQFQASNREARHLTLKLGLEPDFSVNTVQDLRDNLYTFFMPQSTVSLRFFRSDGLIVDIDGMVEDFQAPFFTQEPEATLFITCFLPDFLAISPIVVNSSTVTDTTDFLVNYVGNIKTGFTLVMNVNRSFSAFTIYNKPPDNSVRSFDFASDMVAGDIITISTVAGSKSVTRTRSGVTTSVLYGKTPQSDWIQLVPGDNRLRVYAAGAPIPYSISYAPRYGGL